ncbi:disulfide bond formation protein B [Legionella sp.]|uniref:disulfide bond formation protein B n=1 Tax=Legionella sp. TaxID=459 RepID=UPI003CA64923
MTKLTFKRLQTVNALLTLCVLFSSFYFQYIVGLTPCPLCIMQRVCVFLLLAIMGLSFCTVQRAHYISLLQIIFAGVGLFFALRQLWLQSFPPSQVPACMPGLDILIHYFPWQTIMHTLFWGTGECAEITWSFWGISMPGWSALYFTFMVLMGCFLFLSTRSSRFDLNNF